MTRPCSRRPGDQFLDLRINQRFAAANGNHRRIAFLRHGETFFQRHHVLEVRGIFADAPAAGAGQVAGVQRFELQNHREFRGFANLMFDDVTGNFNCQCKWETHNIFNGWWRFRWIFPGSRPARSSEPSFFNKCPAPGRKNVAGDTLCVVLIPLQPASANGNAASTASHRKNQFNLTC